MKWEYITVVKTFITLALCELESHNDKTKPLIIDWYYNGGTGDLIILLVYGLGCKHCLCLFWMVKQGNPHWRGRFSTVDLPVVTSLDQWLMIIQTLSTFYKTSCLNEEVNCTKPFLWAGGPWLSHNTKGTAHFLYFHWI